MTKNEISAAEYRALKGLDNAVPKPRNKYNARSTVVDGMHFPSKLEAAVWAHLKLMEQVWEYREITRYPSVKLPGGVTWKIDIACKESYVDDKQLFCWRPCYVEVKGVETADYKVKLKLYREFGDRPLHIWKGTARKPFITETVLPKGMK